LIDLRLFNIVDQPQKLQVEPTWLTGHRVFSGNIFKFGHKI